MMRPVFVSVITVNSQYITIKKGESRGREAIANVKEIRFYGDPWWLTSDGMTVLRGDDVDKIGTVSYTHLTLPTTSTV